jgi:hypothetical protein
MTDGDVKFDLLGDPIEEPRETRGRPQHSADDRVRATVQLMSAYGIPQDEIAAAVGVDPTTLREHYRRELDTASTFANAKVAGNLYKIANGEGREAVTACIFWLKTRAGWREAAPRSPDWEPIRDRPLGKKEQALRDAATAGEGSAEWGDDLRPTRLN